MNKIREKTPMETTVHIGEMLYTNNKKARKQASPILEKSMMQVSIDITRKRNFELGPI